MQGKLPRLTAAIFRRGGRAERNLRAVDAPLHQPHAEIVSSVWAVFDVTGRDRVAKRRGRFALTPRLSH